MGLRRAKEFHQDEVRITLTNGLAGKRVADATMNRNVNAEQVKHSAPRHRCGFKGGFGVYPRE